MNLQVEKIRLLLIGQIALSQREMSEAGVQLVGLAGAAKDGLRLVQRLKPDLVVIAVNMPEPADLVAIEEVMKIQPTPILLVAERCEERLAQDAVRRGALEVMATASDSGGRRQLLHKIRLLAGVKVIRHISGGKALPPAGEAMFSTEPRKAARAVVIASSLGGALILETVLSQLAEDFPAPIVVAQHISEGFSGELADWLNHKTALAVRVAGNGDELRPGTVWIAPPEYDVRIAVGQVIALSACRPGVIYHPCCDSLLTSAAAIYRSAAVGVILTGMGSDGVEGLAAIKRAGGMTIAQDEQSSLIYNMPRLAVERGVVDCVVSAEGIAAELKKAVGVC